MKKFLLMCFSFGFAISVWAQDRVVTGKLTSKEDGSALPGVNVVLKGTTSGTVSDADGSFKLNVPESGAILQFSFIGLMTQEIAVADKTVIDVAMQSDISQLSEVIVTGLAIPRDAKTIGYAVAKIRSDELNLARVTNPALALSGLVSGLQINQTDNGVNNAPRIVLRGNRSLLGNNQALIVIDGMPVNADQLNSMNPLDVENVSILKGGAAAALYGSTAANGVILYTTKHGKKNQAPEITFSTTTQLEKVSFLPNLQTRFGMFGGESFGSASAYTLDPNFIAPYISYENQNYGPEFNGKTVPLGYPLADGSQAYTTYSQKYNDHLNFWNTGVTSQNDISISAGGEKSSIHFSFQDMNKSGTTPKDVFRRDVFRVNGMSEYGKFKLNYRVQYTQGDENTNYAPGANRLGTVYWAWMNVGMSIPLTSLSDWRNNKYASPSGWYDDFYPNPYWLLDNNRRSKKTSDFMGNVEGSLEVTKWLSLLGRVGLTTRTLHQSDRNAAINFDPTIVYPLSARLSTPGTVPAGVAETYLFQKRINIDVFATISHNITPDLSLKAIVGGNVFDDFSSGINGNTTTLQPFTPTVYSLQYRNGNLGGGAAENRQRRLSEYGDLALTYKRYLTLHGSYRSDQTSLLAANNRSFAYPELDVAFVLSDAFPALFDNSIFSYAKISTSISKVGNISVGPYALQNVFQSGTPFSGALGNVPVLFQGTSQIAQNLKPEFTLSKEVNLDLGFWSNRILFGASYYQSNTTAQTVAYGVSPSTGYTNALINTGEMLNQGLELDLKFIAIQASNGFKWTIKPNYTNLINNKVLSIAQGIPSINVFDNGSTNNAVPQIATPTANPVNTFAVVGRQYPDLQTSDFARDPQGHVIVDGVTGNPVISPNLRSFGQTNPKHRLGIVNTFEYKGFALTVVIDYRAGAVFYNQLGRDIEFTGIGYQSAQAGRQPFVYPNSVVKNADGSYTPNTTLTVPEGNINFWTATYGAVGGNYVTSGDFWKLRQAALSYKLPSSLLSKTKLIKSATVTLTGRNLLMWRPKSNQWTDPEFAGDNSNAVGVSSAFQNPPSRLFGANLTFTF